MELHEAAGTQRAAPNSSDGDGGVVVVWGNAVEDTLDAVEVCERGTVREQKKRSLVKLRVQSRYAAHFQL